VTPVNRWKLVSFVLAGCMSYSWWHGDARSATKPASAQRLKGPLRVSAAALGVSVDELIRQLFAAKDVETVRAIAEKLGAVGDDHVIEAVMPLLDDPRDGVATAIIAAFGTIATDHAVDVLAKLATGPQDGLHVAAVEALGATHNPRAETVLIEVAQHNGDDAQAAALSALGDIGSERGVEVLAKIATHPGDISVAAVRALARIELPSAKAALLALVDSPSLAVASTAIGELKDFDDALIEKLAGIVTGGDRELVGACLGALARAGEAGIPVLKQAALDGPVEVRIAAMNALVETHDPQVLDTLRTILDNEDGKLADAAASAIADIDSDEAREVLISAALSDRASETRAVEYLMKQSGPEVEQALLVIAKSDSKQRWDAAQHLIKQGNAEALALAVGEARGGSDDTTKLAAMQVLADSGSQPAVDALVEIVRGAADLKPRALGMLGDARPDDPVVGKLLHDAVQSTNPDEAAAAAAALAKVGTPEARDALVAALTNADLDVARNALTSLGKFRLSDEATAAYRTAIVAHPELKTQVMQQLVAGGTPFGLELAKQAITGGDGGEAYRAIEALQQAGSPAAFDVLALGARAQDSGVRAEAIGSLGATGDKRALDVCAQSLHDSDINVRYTAVRTIAAMGTEKARDMIVNLSRSNDTDDRRAAVSNLRRFDDQNTTRRLMELMRDPDPSVAYSAIDASADRPEAQATLRGLLADRNLPAYVRRSAAQALSYRGVSDPSVDAALNAGYDE
jgi:HEAT repeat protein